MEQDPKKLVARPVMVVTPPLGSQVQAQADRLLWEAVRRGLLMVVRAIELRYNIGKGSNGSTEGL